jgi:hypothetical protein
MPWVASEQGAFLHMCRDTRCSAFKGVAYSKTWQLRSYLNLEICERSMWHLFIDV